MRLPHARPVVVAVLSLPALVPLLRCAPAPQSGPRLARASASASTRWAGFRHTVRLLPTGPDRLSARATLENVTDGTRTAEFPWCLVWLRVYRGDRLVWDQARHQPCEGLVRYVTLGPGDREVAHASLRAREILGRELPDGTYTVRAYVPGPVGRGPPRAARELTLGSVELGRGEEASGEDPGARPGGGSRTGPAVGARGS